MKNLIQLVLILITVSHRCTTGTEMVVKYAMVGEDITLQAPEPNGKRYYWSWWLGKADEGHQIGWYNHFGGNQITTEESWKTRVSISGRMLTIKKIPEELFGTISCKLTVNNQHFYVTYQLIKLSVSKKPASALLPGESLSLSCNVGTSQSVDQPVVQWLNPQGEEVRGPVTKSVTVQDHGQWTCVVTKDRKVTVSVTVVDLSPSPLHQYTSKYSPLTIPCSIPAHINWTLLKDKDIQDVQWHFLPKPSSSLKSNNRQRLFSLSLDPLSWEVDQDRQLKNAPDLEGGNLTLTRYRGKEEDSGNYTCSMRFKNGVILSRSVYVEVLQIFSSPGAKLISGQRVNLSCSTGHPLPSDVQLKWFPPEKSSLQGSDPQPAHLTIPEVGAGDSGKWRCELWRSKTRLTFAVIMLKIEPKLSVWMLVTICSAAAIIILLLVLAFILYRRRQRKMRHLRPRLCQCKNPKGFYRT